MLEVTAPVICSICGEAIYLSLMKDANDKLYIELQGKVWIKVRGFFVCKECEDIIMREE
jgi:hypothetical protein